MILRGVFNAISQVLFYVVINFSLLGFGFGVALIVTVIAWSVFIVFIKDIFLLMAKNLRNVQLCIFPFISTRYGLLVRYGDY